MMGDNHNIEQHIFGKKNTNGTKHKAYKNKNESKEKTSSIHNVLKMSIFKQRYKIKNTIMKRKLSRLTPS